MSVESNSKTIQTTQSDGPAGPGGKDSGPAPISPRRAIVGVVVFFAVAAAVALIGIHMRRVSAKALAEHTRESAAPAVLATVPKPGNPINSFMLPGNVSAYTDSPIYARASGYLTRWYYDLGARVKKGALLAEISSPELDQQLLQAEADLATAQATATNAKSQSERYAGLVGSNAVSRQDTETLMHQAAATSASVRSAQANVQRLRELQSFEKVYAPFDGVVTARTVDIGQLITAGSAQEMFHLQAIQTLRVYVSVPQVYAAAVKRGQKVDLTFAEYATRTFEGTLVRTADAIDPVTRTLLIEVDVDNRDGELLPGSLAQVHFKMPQPNPTLVVPVTALIFRKEGLRVGTVVNSSSGPVARLVPVVIGEDDGATVQIVSGLSASDHVIQDPPDSLIDGERVQEVSGNEAPRTGGKQ